MSSPISNPRVYAPGAAITTVASAAVLARRLVKITGNRANGSNVPVAHADAGGRTFGVATDTAAPGQLVVIARGGVVKVTASGALAAFGEVEVGTDGKAKAKASGIAIGYALTGTTDGLDAEIALY